MLRAFGYGCYWHRHEGCRFCYSPKSNVAFWTAKFERNKDRDRAALSKLKQDGWDPLCTRYRLAMKDNASVTAEIFDVAIIGAGFSGLAAVSGPRPTITGGWCG